MPQFRNGVARAVARRVSPDQRKPANAAPTTSWPGPVRIARPGGISLWGRCPGHTRGDVAPVSGAYSYEAFRQL
jgi:hypothetical protein